ncbi:MULTISPECIES: FkbM family methyltransferase [Nostoc]|uniref:FkbM family methyltransferase n=1 Tax=Nostoc paludosum FACHB-159 TaxID=2692908 RepID=A0ABR8K2I3_9NOSO|nr:MULTISPECIES: FkbM family methyltransferase [Nostoc]MBD2676362.1 FkbM family methyltransferase [Nostoc sp. FACHB-857]MBD2732510.1 FkbM family methyltransferase [Nostoc paludosum FACHB-159]
MKTQLVSRAFQKVFRRVFQLLSIDEITGTKVVSRNDLLHIGTDYGGWVVPKDLLNADSTCYCVGCGEDITFDLGLIEQFNCHVYAFDPTPRAIKHVREHAADYQKYHFSDIGLWNQEEKLRFYAPKNSAHISHSALNLQKTEEFFEAQVDRLANVMHKNGHTHLDLLKLDIEGAEYKVVNSIIEDKLDIKILCVEYDECFNPLDTNYRDRIKESVTSILQFGYSLVYAQGNGNYTFVKEI